MLSIFGKLLCRELGKERYDIYFENYSCGSNKNDIIFGDIYKFLMKEDIGTTMKIEYQSMNFTLM